MTANRWSIGIQPINWSNDDFHDLGGEISLEQCLGEMQEAGYEGTELGHKFPTDDTLQELLASYGLRLASGWHSTYLLSQPLADEEASFLAHLRRLKACGSEVVIVAECTDRTYDDRVSPFDLSAPVTSMERLCRGLERLSEIAAGEGFRVAYHHHLGTVIQDEAEILALLDGTETLGLALDTGHLTAAGVDPVSLIERHGSRITHVHFKNVRPGVVAVRARHIERQVELGSGGGVRQLQSHAR